MEKGIDFTKMTKAEKNFIRNATHKFNIWEKKNERNYEECNKSYSGVQFDDFGLAFYSCRPFTIEVVPILNNIPKSIPIYSLECSSLTTEEFYIYHKEEKLNLHYSTQKCSVNFLNKSSWGNL